MAPSAAALAHYFAGACDAAQRSRQREKSRQVRDLKECCSGDTQCRRNVPFLPPEGKSRVAARARRPVTAPAGDESGREANTRANRPLQVAGGPNTAL